MSPEQREKRDMLEKKVKDLRLKMLTMMAAKQAMKQADDEGDGNMADVVEGEP